MNVEKLKEYTLLKQEKIADIRSMGYLLRHDKSGARVMVLENDDENKVFNIAFARRRRTVQGCPTFWSTACCAGPGNFL